MDTNSNPLNRKKTQADGLKAALGATRPLGQPRTPPTPLPAKAVQPQVPISKVLAGNSSPYQMSNMGKPNNFSNRTPPGGVIHRATK